MRVGAAGKAQSRVQKRRNGARGGAGTGTRGKGERAPGLFTGKEKRAKAADARKRKASRRRRTRICLFSPLLRKKGYQKGKKKQRKGGGKGCSLKASWVLFNASNMSPGRFCVILCLLFFSGLSLPPCVVVPSLVFSSSKASLLRKVCTPGRGAMTPKGRIAVSASPTERPPENALSTTVTKKSELFLSFFFLFPLPSLVKLKDYHSL